MIPTAVLTSLSCFIRAIIPPFPGLFLRQSVLDFLNGVFSFVDYRVYFIVYGITVLAVLGALVNVYYVGISFREGSFKWVWPVKTLRLLVTYLVCVACLWPYILVSREGDG